MAQPSRRSVLRAGVVLTAAAVPLGYAERALSAVTGTVRSGLRRATFAPHVGTSFAFSDGDRVYAAELTKVADVRTAPRGHDRKFRLVFDIEGGPAQGTYLVKHPRVSDLDLFVSPISQDGRVYEAIVDAR